ncbi:hypothetical protein OLEAN_C37570 [Oleispira antarctica RB-8]|uniref:Uncharacterized protein n=1 Tax=Oleispira antarctica RB-8 TaxID=698738 RepID=R4YUK2_OLEAN|nr:hypothetical protein OLEAN_C37570 [Oleispira antarctica RB-8]
MFSDFTFSRINHNTKPILWMITNLTIPTTLRSISPNKRVLCKPIINLKLSLQRLLLVHIEFTQGKYLIGAS